MGKNESSCISQAKGSICDCHCSIYFSLIDDVQDEQVVKSARQYCRKCRTMFRHAAMGGVVKTEAGEKMLMNEKN